MVFKRFTWVIFTTSALTPYSVVYITLYAIYSVYILKQLFKYLGGRDGIRTHGTVARTHAFQACSLNHSDTLP